MGPQSEQQSKSLSIRAFAKRVGVNEKAVRKAIVRGRLSSRSVGDLGGKPKIVNVEVALEEWGQNAGKVGGSSEGAVSLAEAQRQVALERHRGLKLANDEKRGRLIPADRAARDAFEAARVIRDAILNIPVRLAAEIAAETDASRVLVRLDQELRLALESAATSLQR